MLTLHPFTWKQESSPIHLEGTLNTLSGTTQHPFSLTLKINHPPSFTVALDTALTPFFLSSFRFENIKSKKTAQGTTLEYLLYPIRAMKQEFVQADLICLPEGTQEPPIRMPLQIPPLEIIEMLSNTPSIPYPLDPLPISIQENSLALNDLHTPMQVDSWQHNTEVMREQGAPWGSLALLVTTLVLIYGVFSFIKRYLSTLSVKKPPQRDALEEVNLQLANLEQRKLVETNAFNAYYTSLVATLRWYLKSRFPDQTKLPLEVQQLQADLIAYADPVKFGKHASTASDCALALAYVKHCVHLVEKERNEKTEPKGKPWWFQKWLKKQSG